MWKPRKPKKPTKTDYQYFLNEIGIPEDEKQSNGGRCRDSTPYGWWLRKHDPVAFNAGYNEWILQTYTSNASVD